MARDGLTEEDLVLDLDAGHVEQVFDAIVHFEFAGEGGSIFIFDRVLTFQTSGKIHWHEPTGQKTRCTERATDRPEDLFANIVWPGIEFSEPFADASPMVPFLSFDLFDTYFFGRVSQRFPVPSISICSCDLAGIGVPQDSD